MSRVGAGAAALTARNPDANPRTILELTADTETPERAAGKDEPTRNLVIDRFKGCNGGIGTPAHQLALQRRALLRQVMKADVTTRAFGIDEGSSLAIGLGNFSPSTELGLTLHRTIGVPYLPSSALRGLTRAWAREEGKLATADRLFGTKSAAGLVRFLDAFPELTARVDSEVMTPHFTEWYMNQATPGEWLLPVPVRFLVVRSGAFLIDVVAFDATAREEALLLLVDAFGWLGIGGKTTSGFGALRPEGLK